MFQKMFVAPTAEESDSYVPTYDVRVLTNENRVKVQWQCAPEVFTSNVYNLDLLGRIYGRSSMCMTKYSLIWNKSTNATHEGYQVHFSNERRTPRFRTDRHVDPNYRVSKTAPGSTAIFPSRLSPL